MEKLLLVLIPVGLIILVSLPCAFLSILAYRRKKKGRRSPFSGSLLRSPGQSLLPQIDALTDDINSDLYGVIMVPLMVFSLAMAQFYFGYLTPTPWNIALHGFICLAAILFVAHKLSRRLIIRNELRLGLEAEMAVGQELNHLMREGYYVYHDFPAENFNIDHVAVGAGGIFAIETKGRSKPDKGRGTYDATVTFDGNVLRFPDWKDHKFIEQARRQAEWLKRWVSSAIGEDVQVWPALALPGWYIERKGKSDVLLYNGKNPNSLVRVQGKGVLTDNQIKRINHQFEQRCRDVEPVAYRKEKKEASRG